MITICKIAYFIFWLILNLRVLTVLNRNKILGDLTQTSSIDIFTKMATLSNLEKENIFLWSTFIINNAIAYCVFVN